MSLIALKFASDLSVIPETPWFTVRLVQGEGRLASLPTRIGLNEARSDKTMRSAQGASNILPKLGTLPNASLNWGCPSCIDHEPVPDAALKLESLCVNTSTAPPIQHGILEHGRTKEDKT